MQIDIPNVGTKTICDLTSKDIYKVFLLNNVPIIPSKQYWFEKFGTNEIDWDTLFMVNSINVFMPRPVKDFNWRLTHGLVNFNSKLHHMKNKDGSPFSDGNCGVCTGGILESGQHCIYECPNSTRLWKKVEGALSYTEEKQVTITSQHAMTGFWKDGTSDLILLKNMVIGITRFHIWKVRNSIKLDGKSIDINGSCNILRTTLINHIGVLLSLYKENEPLGKYLNRFKQGIIEHGFI